MRKIVGIMAALLVVLLASAAEAQTQPSTPSDPSHNHPAGPSQTPATPSGAPMMGHGGMMGQGGMKGGGMMGQGGMSGMMCPMMGMRMGAAMMGGMPGASDPKAMARMLKLRGDMLKAMGEVLLKHAQELEQEK
jgi:hypothetical protein